MNKNNEILQLQVIMSPGLAFIAFVKYAAKTNLSFPPFSAMPTNTGGTMREWLNKRKIVDIVVIINVFIYASRSRKHTYKREQAQPMLIIASTLVALRCVGNGMVIIYVRVKMFLKNFVHQGFNECLEECVDVKEI
ncbi:hypothetical protein GQX74_006373 [Glossina fuscipes]|nr:hypothetical protein GQX74_006373 [Glossina fuscipes]